MKQNVTGAASNICVWALYLCPWFQRKPSNFLSALGPQSMDTKIIKHSLSFIYSLCNWYFFSFPFSLNFLYWTQTVLYTENDCLSINKTTTATLQSLFLWHFLLFSTLFFSKFFRDSLSCSLLWVFLQLIFSSLSHPTSPYAKKKKTHLITSYTVTSSYAYSKLSMVLTQLICLFGDLFEDLFEYIDKN